MRKRDVHDEEQALWREVTRDVKRLRAGAKRTSKKRADVPAPAPPTAAAAAPVAKPAVPAPAKPRRAAAFGLDGATAERLKRGKVAPDATLDLHGMTQAEAHARLSAFVRRGHELGHRCLLVVTGKGSPAPRDAEPKGFVMPERSKAGVLKLMVPRWLEEHGVVAGVQNAHQRHGGAGALYVYLRRRRA